MIMVLLMLISSVSITCSEKRRAMTPPPRYSQINPQDFCSRDPWRLHTATTPTNTTHCPEKTETNSAPSTLGKRSPLTPIGAWPLAPEGATARSYQKKYSAPTIATTANAATNTHNSNITVLFPPGHSLTIDDMQLLLANEARLYFYPQCVINIDTLEMTSQWVCAGLVLKNGTTIPLTRNS